MQKKSFLAIILSVLVLFLWQALMRKVYHIENKEVMQQLSEQSTSSPEKIESAPVPLSVPTTNDTIPESLLEQTDTSKLKLDYVNPGGKISKIFLKDYNLSTEIRNSLYLKSMENSEYTFKKYIAGENELSVEQIGHLNVQKLKVDKNPYYFKLEVVYKNSSDLTWKLSDKLVVNVITSEGKPQERQLFEAVFFDQEVIRKNPSTVKNTFSSQNSLKAVGFRDRYSCIIVSPEDSPATKGYIEKSNNQHIEIGLDMGEIEVLPQSQKVFNYLVYIGPQNSTTLKQANQGFEELVHYGTFNFISKALLSVMKLFYKITRNWGLALILLTVFIFSMTYPLTLKQMRSMKEMQELQPHIEALKKNNKDNSQRLNKEIMELYRRHKINPLGGCLPMILQIPVFFGLYQALSRAIVLKGSKFLWIKDLAEPDKLFQLPQPLPFIGTEINLLPLLMAFGMGIQQKLSLKTSASTPEMLEQQKLMATIFPIMFGFIFYHFPSGLALYWFLNTSLSTLSQWKILKAKALATN